MKSEYGDRDTVGSIYLEAQKSTMKGYTLQDFSSQMSQGLIDDINKELQSNPFEGRPFYLNVVEERDLQMKNALKRRMIKSLYAPYPEDSSLVLYMTPKDQSVKYCWDLPHHSEFYNVITHSYQYDQEYIRNIKNWINNDLSNFGFIKVSMDSSQVEGYKEKTINAYRDAYYKYCDTLQMDKKSIENEKKLGFFWIPNKFFKYKDVTEGKGGSKIFIV